MALVLTEEQELLKETVAEFVRENSPVSRFRELRDSGDATGFSRELWKEMAGLGWTGIVYPEEYGGSDLGYAELGVVVEELGRTLVPEPFVSTVLLAGNAILLGGTAAHKQELLTGVCEGEIVLALAFQETGRFDPYAVSTKAEASGGGFTLTGEKRFVLDGHVADRLVVVARCSGSTGERDGLGLFVVDPADAAVSVTRTSMIDSRNASIVRLDGVQVASEDVVGQVGQGADLLDAVFDRASIGLSAEMLGSIHEAFESTIEFLKTRHQFGVPIGSFQALKHRAALMFCEVELCQSVVLEALRAIDDQSPGVPTLASAAKARLSDAAMLVTCEGVQMFGGGGMTDEEDIGLFLKRARAAELTLGDASYHRDRFARLNAY